MRNPLFVLLAALLLMLPASAAAQPGPTRVRLGFCGEGALRTYPLSNEGIALHGLLLHQFTIANVSDTPLEVTSVEIELLRQSEAVDRRLITPSDLVSLGNVSRQLEAVPVVKQSFDLICGAGRLVPAGVALAGPSLAPRQAILIPNQVFAFDGTRDALRVRVGLRSAGRTSMEEAILPISTEPARTRLRFPVRGLWLVKSGPSFHTHHRWARRSEFALDLVQFGADGRSRRGDGAQFADYLAYGQPVLAAADGRVARVVNDRPESIELLKRPGETMAAYSQRIAPIVRAHLEGGADAVSGNHVILDHGNGEYSFYGHLQPNSVSVRPGQAVRAGEPIARVGGSGNALVEPHLHFHLCDRPTPLACTGLPASFEGLLLPHLSFGPRPPQSGDIVIAE